MAPDVKRKQQVLVDVAGYLVEVHLRKRRVVRAAARDHELVDRLGKVVEEVGERGRIGDVERRGAQRAELARGVIEALAVATGDDDLGALGAGSAGGLE